MNILSSWFHNERRSDGRGAEVLHPQNLDCQQICSTSIVQVDDVLLIKREESPL